MTVRLLTPDQRSQTRQHTPTPILNSWVSTAGKVAAVIAMVSVILVAFLCLDFILASVITAIVLGVGGSINAANSCCNFPMFSANPYNSPRPPGLLRAVYTPQRQHYAYVPPLNPVRVQPIPGGRGAAVVARAAPPPPLRHAGGHAIPGRRR